ncbi:methyltransferase family protein [Noviherbaspirillum sedimenti]|uniref:Isoprenylcysteine carboxylmethyltransferase family protein n=1 Tax=Noviherbaspirillum sedimenti TaxID=2320865 RepID=A0A3A3G4N1_9BURK|nr:isoprenylcysteine carboxylmethyltransferase family protein [Noviherbaspirillum sedimenti]RJG03453.1 isoprenylcysteine carboxylmethyltransferase family protein [Noviherbaspirillum sedimenti]
MRALELKIPPPLVALACAAMMYALAQLAPGWRWSWPHSDTLGAGVAMLGAILDMLGIMAFRRAKTTVNPLKPSNASSIVQSGIYRHTRNPMYLGMLFVLLGFALYLAHPLAFLLLPVFIAYLTRFQILPEERILATKFGAEYTDYASRVRRWV